MSELYQSLAHSKWDCKPCGVCAQETAENHFRKHPPAIGSCVPRSWPSRKNAILEGHLMPDQVHICITPPPKHPVASVIGFLKGKSAIAIARMCGKERNFSGEHF